MEGAISLVIFRMKYRRTNNEEKNDEGAKIQGCRKCFFSWFCHKKYERE
jgi:hypothetical protein